MLTHPWILTESDGSNAGSLGNKKKVNQISQMNIDSHSNKGSSNNLSSTQRLRLTLKELLNVSSDWKDVNKKNPSNSS